MVTSQQKIAGIIACLLGGTSVQALAEESNEIFTLGEIAVTGKRDTENPLGTATLDREQLWDFSKNGVADALNLIPGVATTMVSGPGRRNESDISLRGLDRTRVPLTIDGIRLFLPADNRIDYGRFLTPDLSEIQVAKGYVSVINGPDGMGGAINLVTRKPVKDFEGEIRYSALLGGGGQHDGDIWYANLGGSFTGKQVSSNAILTAGGFQKIIIPSYPLLPRTIKATVYAISLILTIGVVALS